MPDRLSRSRSTRPPLVSVIIATYNHEDYLSQAIDSVLAQKRDFEIEIILAEDCSTDGTRGIAEKYSSAYPDIVRLISGHENVGLMRNCLRALKASTGKFIAFCEGDDWWCDHAKLEAQIGSFSNPLVGMVHGNYKLGRLIGGVWRSEPFGALDRTDKQHLRGDKLFPVYLNRLIPRFSSTVFRRELVQNFLASSLADPDFPTLDQPLTLFAAAAGSIDYREEIGTVYRHSPNSITRSGLVSMLKFLYGVENIYGRVEQLYGERADFDPCASSWVFAAQAKTAFRLNDGDAFKRALDNLHERNPSVLRSAPIAARRIAMALPGGARAANLAIDLTRRCAVDVSRLVFHCRRICLQ